jgi:hypothetical protein
MTYTSSWDRVSQLVSLSLVFPQPARRWPEGTRGALNLGKSRTSTLGICVTPMNLTCLPRGIGARPVRATAIGHRPSGIPSAGPRPVAPRPPIPGRSPAPGPWPLALGPRPRSPAPDPWRPIPGPWPPIPGPRSLAPATAPVSQRPLLSDIFIWKFSFAEKMARKEGVW